MKHILQKILKENDINHSQFARDLNIARSYAVAILNGTKPVTDTIYKKLMSLDYISGKYIEDISNEYFKIKYGANELKLVKYFLELGRKFTFEPIQTKYCETEYPLPQAVGTPDKDGIIRTACTLLHKAIAEKTTFYTNYPFGLEELDDSLYAVYKNEYLPDKPLISHIISLSGETDKEAILSYWKCLKWGNLRVTTSVISGPTQKGIMPYYVVCGNAVLLFSEDMVKGIVFISSETADYYAEEHNKRAESARPSIKIINDESELLTGQDFVTLKYLKSLSTYICPMNVCDYDMLYRTTTDNPEKLKDALIRAYINYYGYTKAQNILFTYYTNDTFENWMKNGLLYNVSEKYLHEFSVEDRITALNNVIDGGMYLMMKKDTANFYRGYDASSTDKRVITHFVLTNPGHTDYEIYMGIDKNKYRGLDDFTSALFAYIELGNRVYTREESDFMIRQLQELYK